MPEEHAQRGLVKRTGRDAPDLVHLQASGDSGWSPMCNNNNGALIYKQEKTTLLPSVNIISLGCFVVPRTLVTHSRQSRHSIKL